MAYRIDNYDDSLVIDGWENGIADSPFAGIADMKNVNITSIPGEVSVNFSSVSVTPPSISSISVLSADPGTDVITISSTPTLKTWMSVTFSGGSLPVGITSGDIYWVSVLTSSTIKIYSDYRMTQLVDITASGTGSISTIDMGMPKYFASSRSAEWMIDSNGRVWSSLHLSGIFWTYTGNKPNNYSHGEGLVYYESSDRTGYLFAFSRSSIDVMTTDVSTSWAYQWSPSTAGFGTWSATPSAVLKTPVNMADVNHEAITAPDSRVYFCDKDYIGRWYQTSPSVAFDPNSLSTYTFDETHLLSVTDQAQCITFMGSQLFIGGIKNVIYPWDRYSTNFDSPILIAENNISKMITVNTSIFILAGNRGRIYITNGSQAQAYKKIPDHISGTIEPYFTWGGMCSSKNQLYVSALVNNNASSGDISGYGGVWAIDLDTQSMRLSNKLSYDTYYGYASALWTLPGNPQGVGIIAGWQSGDGSTGLDSSSSNPYTNYQASIDTDLIPIGTFDNPRNFTRIEYKLTKPMVSGENITIKYRKDLSQNYTTIFSDSTAGRLSSSEPVNFENVQWIQFQIILNSTATNPSYVRLKEIRLKGLIGETVGSSQMISI